MSNLWAQCHHSNVTGALEAIIHRALSLSVSSSSVSEVNIRIGGQHPYRRSTSAFDGTREFRGPPPRVHASKVIKRAKQRVEWLENGGSAGSRGDPVQSMASREKTYCFHCRTGSYVKIYNACPCN